MTRFLAGLPASHRIEDKLLLYTIRYDTIEEFNVDCMSRTSRLAKKNFTISGLPASV